MGRDRVRAAQDTKAGASPQTEKINEYIAQGWKTADITRTALRADDYEFMRRAFIDLIGRIPTPEEIVDFRRDSSSNKRARLVYRLLNETGYKPRDGNGKTLKAIKGLRMPKDGIDYNDAYANNLADIWTTWLLTRSNTTAALSRTTAFLAIATIRCVAREPSRNSLEQDRLRSHQRHRKE